MTTATAEGSAFLQYQSFVEEMAGYLKGVKEEFDAFEAAHPREADQIAFLERRRDDVFRRTDFYFEKTWLMVAGLSEEERAPYKDFYVKALFPYIWKGCEFNTYIRAKPLGYDGDFVMMNYIYDYHDRRYYGHNLHAKLINNYTCNVDISCANIARKEFFKEEVFQVASQKSGARILSIGSGPARELTELLREGRIPGVLDFYCLDFEQKAIDFVKEQLSGISYDRKKVRVHFIHTDLIRLVKGKAAPLDLKDFDFIYISGVCDYLSPRLCKRLAEYFFEILLPGAALIMANISLSNARHRAYYEFLGDWKMYHRLSDELIEWMEGIKAPHHYALLNVKGCEGYHFIRIEKP